MTRANLSNVSIPILDGRVNRLYSAMKPYDAALGLPDEIGHQGDSKNPSPALTPQEIAFFRNLTDSLPSQVAIVCQSGEILLANPAWSQRENAGSDPEKYGMMSIKGISTDLTEGLAILNHIAQISAGNIKCADLTFSTHIEAKLKFFRLRATPLKQIGCRNVIVVVEDISELHNLAKEKSLLLQQLLQSEEAERRRIAREMHDGTAPDLVAIELTLLQLSSCDLDTKTKAFLAEASLILSKVKEDIRTMSYLLHPPVLRSGGLIDALELVIDGLARRMQLRINFDHDAALPLLSFEVEHSLFRITQESLMNVYKHTSANSASVSLHCVGSEIVLKIQDDGEGFYESGHSTPLGIGIEGMRARLQLLGGKLLISQQSNGTEVKATIPMTAFKGLLLSIAH